MEAVPVAPTLHILCKLRTKKISFFEWQFTDAHDVVVDIIIKDKKKFVSNLPHSMFCLTNSNYKYEPFLRENPLNTIVEKKNCRQKQKQLKT